LQQYIRRHGAEALGFVAALVGWSRLGDDQVGGDGSPYYSHTDRLGSVRR
jgi:hypothetical protein